MLQAGGEGELDGRPWRLRLSGCCPRATVHSWFCRLVRPRRSDCAMMAMSLVCFISSLSLEAVLLLQYEEHVMLVVASLVIAALLLASCCMGLLVWWKGPQWADDDRDAAAWVRDEHRPLGHSAPPQVCTARHNHPNATWLPWHACSHYARHCQPRHMNDEDSESDHDEERTLLRDRSTAPAAFDEDEYCYNCLLDECTAAVGAIVGIVSVTAGLLLGWDIASALHNERLIISLLAQADSTATNITLASLAGSSVAQSSQRRAHVVVPIVTNAQSQPPRGLGPITPAPPVHTSIPQDLQQTYVNDHPELQITPSPEDDTTFTAAVFCNLEASVRIETTLASRTCNSGTGECACVAPLVDDDTLQMVQDGSTGAAAFAASAATVFAFCECGWTGEVSCPDWTTAGRVGWVMRSDSKPLVGQLWGIDLRLPYRAVDVLISVNKDHASPLTRVRSGDTTPRLVETIDSPAALAAGYRASAKTQAMVGVGVTLVLLFNLAFVRRQRCSVEVKTPCSITRFSRSMLTRSRRSCCCVCGRGESSRSDPLILVHARPTAIDEEGAELEVLVAEPATMCRNGTSPSQTEGVVVVVPRDDSL